MVVDRDPRHDRPPGASLADHAALWIDMEPHTALLTELASEARTVVEWGVRSGVSTWALLDGLPPDGRMVSVDVERFPLPRRITDDPRWSFVLGEDLEVDLPPADLVFIDTSHTYEQTIAELRRAKALGASVIALHDAVLDAVRDAIDVWLPDTWTLTVHQSQWGLAVCRRAS